MNTNKHKSERKRRDNGKHDGVIMPVPASSVELPEDYANFLVTIKKRVQTERLKAVLSANATQILMYWDIGNDILQKQEKAGWGAKVIDRLSSDLKEAFPEMNGFSARNLKYMRKFAQSWPDRAIVQRIAAQIPWRNNQALLDKVKDPELRIWYAEQNAVNGWSRNILTIQIDTKLHKRIGQTANNFELTLPPAESDMGKFCPGHVSQLTMYMNIVDDTLRHQHDKPTIGLLLVKEKNHTVAKYALAGNTKPIGVAEWEQQITDSLPENLKPSLPSIEELEWELENTEKSE